MMNSTKKAILLGSTAVMLWSTVAAAFKLTLRYIDPVGLVWWSVLVSFVALFSMVLLFGRSSEAKEYFYTSWKKAALLGAVNPFVYYLTLFEAYELLPAQEAQAINYTWALMLALLSVPILGHKLGKYDIIAGIMGYLGALIIATHGDILSLHFQNPKGVALALSSTVFWSLYWLFNTRSDTNTTAAMFVNFGFGLIYLIIYMISRGTIPHLPNWQAAAGSIYIGLFEMSVTFVLWGRALKSTDKVARISNLIFLSPLLSLFFIRFIIGEHIYYSTFVALALITGGLFVQKRAK